MKYEIDGEKTGEKNIYIDISIKEITSKLVVIKWWKNNREKRVKRKDEKEEAIEKDVEVEEKAETKRDRDKILL